MSEELPEGWASTCFNNLGCDDRPAIKAGPFGSALKKEFYVKSGYRIYGQEQVIAGTLAVGDYYVDRDKFESLKSCSVRPGDILVSLVGTFGKVLVVPENIEPGIINPRLLRLSLNLNAVNPNYIKYFLSSPGVQAGFGESAHGGTMGVLNASSLGSIQLLLPPLPEQRRIVAKVESLLEQVNRMKGRLDKVSAILKRFRQSVLAAACSGELTREWRGNNANGSANNIRTERPTFDDTMAELPDSWQWVQFESVAEFINGDRSKRYPNKAEYVESGLPFINTGHIEPNGTLSLERMNYINRDKWASLTGGKIQKGDLVYCLRGATLGKTAFVEPFDEGAIASSLVIIRPQRQVLNRYVYFFLTSPLGRNEIRKYDNGSAQPNLSAQNVGQYLVPLPPLPEQHEIVRQVGRLFALADTIERRVNVAKARVEKLPQAILTKAFSGQLVPTEAELARLEGRSYETAEALLARIRNEQDESKPTTKPMRKRGGATKTGRQTKGE